METEDLNKNLTLFWWPLPKKEWWNKALGVSHLFPEISGYLKQMFVSNSRLFLLFKYPEDHGRYHHLLCLCYVNLPQTLPQCDVKGIIHNPKLFSWEKAQILCKDASGVLPQFDNKKVQDSFLSLMKKSHEIFPVEAIFLGLKKRKIHQHQVSRPISVPLQWQLQLNVFLSFVLAEHIAPSTGLSREM